MRRLFLFLVLLGVTLLGAQSSSTIQLAWDAPIYDPTIPTQRPDGYFLWYGPTCGDWQVKTDVGNVLTYAFTNLDLTKQYCFTAQTYNNIEGKVSDYAAPALYVPSGPGGQGFGDPRCTLPLGDLAVSIFVTKWEKTTGSAGSRARVNFQLASPNSPITAVQVLLNNVPAETGTVVGSDLTSLGGIWFRYPLTSGTYLITLKANNLYGCYTIANKDAMSQEMKFTIQ